MDGQSREEIARANEAGENTHDAYKSRQRERVIRRLERPHNAPESANRVPDDNEDDE